ncbi:MAG: hypothetical protein ACYCX2_12145 [Christensenellales bacterium]
MEQVFWPGMPVLLVAAAALVVVRTVATSPRHAPLTQTAEFKQAGVSIGWNKKPA